MCVSRVVRSLCFSEREGQSGRCYNVCQYTIMMCCPLASQKAHFSKAPYRRRRPKAAELCKSGDCSISAKFAQTARARQLCIACNHYIPDLLATSHHRNVKFRGTLLKSCECFLGRHGATAAGCCAHGTNNNIFARLRAKYLIESEIVRYDVACLLLRGRACCAA